MIRNLLPCPFCGGEVEISDEKIDATREVYNFHCHNCDMVTFYDFPNDRESAIKQWNTRKPIDNIVEKLKEYAKSKICDNHKKGCPYGDNEDIFCENCGALGAINIVKQEIKQEN